MKTTASQSPLWMLLEGQLVNVDSFHTIQIEGAELVANTAVGRIIVTFNSNEQAVAALNRISAALQARGSIIDATDLSL